MSGIIFPFKIKKKKNKIVCLIILRKINEKLKNNKTRQSNKLKKKTLADGFYHYLFSTSIRKNDNCQAIVYYGT